MAAGCTKLDSSATATTANTSITQVLKSSINAMVFYQGLVLTGLDSVLAGPGPFTVFIPSDSAFSSVGINATALAGFARDSLRSLLLYHTIAGQSLTTASFPFGSSKVIVANGDSVFVSHHVDGLFVNGLAITQPDIYASNGTLQAIGQQPLVPPAGSLLTLIQADTNFLYLAAALARTSAGSTDVQALVSGAAPLTMMAPNNAAFRAQGYNMISDFNNANPDSLAMILLDHLIPYRLFICDIVQGQPINTLASSPLTFLTQTSKFQIKSKGSSVYSTVLSANHMGRNGVLFTIDQLLMP